VKLFLMLLVFVMTSAVNLPVLAAGSNADQKIKLLSNRFRVDQAVEKIVFIIERKPGSAPIILVLPDGSKLYANRHQEGVKWMDGNTGDMIEITRPMIGPWQIIGDILPSSEIRLATALTLKLDAIPEELFIGEKVKLTSRLEFNDKLLALGKVDDLIKLSVYLRADDNKENANFGAGTFIVGEYLDNGHGFDERMGDGVFTGMLDLNRPAGDYNLLVKAGNKVFEREAARTISLLSKPVKVDLMSAAINGHYALRFFNNANSVKLDQLVLQLKIIHPDDTVEHLSINGVAPMHIFRLENVIAPGRYKINIDVVGQSMTGRDFVLPLETLKFKVVLPAKKQQLEDQVELDKAREAKFELAQQMKRAMADRQQKDSESRLVIIIIMVNVLIILIGLLMMWLFLRTKKPKAEKEAKKDDKKSKDKKGKDKK